MKGIQVTKELNTLKEVKDYVKAFSDTLKGLELKIVKIGGRYTLYREILPDDPIELIRYYPDNAEIIEISCK